MNKNLAFVLIQTQLGEVNKEDNKITEFVNREDVRRILTLTTSIFPGGLVAVGILYEKVPRPPNQPAPQADAEKTEPPARKKPRRKGLN